MVSALFQIVIGFTGLIGVLLRFIGPLTIAPTITLIGVGLFNVAAERAGFLSRDILNKDWLLFINVVKWVLFYVQLNYKYSSCF